MIHPSTANATDRSALAVDATNLTLRYGNDVTAFRGLTLRIPQGRHTVILGPSGAGKSSLLACLAGRLLPTEGTVRIHGRVARIHQDLRLVPQTTALQNVLDGALGKMGFKETLSPPTHLVARASSLLQQVGLSHRRHSRVATLSGGEAQRVAIARALMPAPDILLADEPVASLDRANAEAVMTLLRQLQQAHGLTLISVLHDPELAQRYGDEIIHLEPVAADSAVTPLPSLAVAAKAPAMTLPGVTPPLPAAPAAGKAWGYKEWLWPLALLALSVWAVTGLNIKADHMGDAVPTAIAFLTRLIPTPEQWLAMDWAGLFAALAETLRMSVVGTLAAFVLALPLAALAARNVAPRALGWPVRLVLDLWRSVPSIVWALLFVAAVGLGAMAGILGLIAYSLGYLTKFLYESFEAADPGPTDALRELGASGPQRFVRAVWPMSRPVVLGYGLFMFEYNVRAASVLGLVGAGGIGHDLKLAVDWANWHVVGAILLLFGVMVIIVDTVSNYLKSRLAEPAKA